jgi:hypothetical protein
VPVGLGLLAFRLQRGLQRRDVVDADRHALCRFLGELVTDFILDRLSALRELALVGNRLLRPGTAWSYSLPSLSTQTWTSLTSTFGADSTAVDSSWLNRRSSSSMRSSRACMSAGVGFADARGAVPAGCWACAPKATSATPVAAKATHQGERSGLKRESCLRMGTCSSQGELIAAFVCTAPVRIVGPCRRDIAEPETRRQKHGARRRRIERVR